MNLKESETIITGVTIFFFNRFDHANLLGYKRRWKCVSTTSRYHAIPRNQTIIIWGVYCICSICRNAPQQTSELHTPLIQLETCKKETKQFYREMKLWGTSKNAFIYRLAFSVGYCSAPYWILVNAYIWLACYSLVRLNPRLKKTEVKLTDD